MNVNVTKTAEYAQKSKKNTQIPLVNKIYNNRSSIIHKIVASACELYPEQLFIIGGGLDSSYHTYSKNIYHIDYNSIITDLQQRDCLQNNMSNKINLIACDLASKNALSDLENDLKRVHFNPEKCSVILIECVLCYIQSKYVDRLLAWCEKFIKNSILITYDPYTTNNSGCNIDYSNYLYQSFKTRGCPILNKIQNNIEYSFLFRRNKWPHVNVGTVEQFLQLINSRVETQNQVQVDNFDEETGEIHLNQMYGISYSSNSNTCFQELHNKLFPISKVSITDKNEVVTTAAADVINHTNSSTATRCDTVSIEYTHRMNQLSSRLYTLEKQLLTSSDGSGLFFIGKAPCDHISIEKIVKIYAMRFNDVMEKYPSVKKFGTIAMKEMRKSKWQYNEHIKFWVVTKNQIDSKTNLNNSMIVGFIGLKLRKEKSNVSKENEYIGHYHNSNINNVNQTTNEGNNCNNTSTIIGEISHLCVDPNYENKGISKMLIQHVINYMTTLHKDTVNDSNNTNRSGNIIIQKCRIDLSTVYEFMKARSIYMKYGFSVIKEEVLPNDGCRLIYMSLQIDNK